MPTIEWDDPKTPTIEWEDYQPTPPRDMYATQAQDQSFLKNMAAGFGGSLYGLGKGLFMSPEEARDWKASMAGLGTTGGGTIGQIGGAVAPFAAAGPIVGSSALASGGVGLLTGMARPAENWQERASNTAIESLGAGVGQAVGNAFAKRAAKNVADQVATGAKNKALNAVKDTTMRTGRDAGYVLPPSAAGKGSMLETLSGQIKTQQQAAWKNQQVTNNLTRKALGLPDDAPLTSDTMRTVRKEAGKAYDDIAKLGEDFKSAVEKLKQARHDAHEAMNTARQSGNPEVLAEAKVLRKTAEDLENAVDSALLVAGKKDLITKFRAARKRIAMSYDVQDAIVEATGDVKSNVMARAYDEGMKGFGPRLTDELETVGRFGQAFPQQTAWRSFQPLPNSALDAMTSSVALGAGQGHPAALAAAAVPYTRNPVRNYLLNEGYQNALMRPGYGVTSRSKVASELLNSPLASRLYPALGMFGLNGQ